MEEKLTILIEKLADQLGETTEATWGILVAQAKIAAITNFVAGGVFILLAIVSIWLGYIVRRAEKADNDTVKSGIGIGILLALTFLALSLAFIIPAITATFNPEYWALSKLIGLD
ncbi:MAG: hypothetical protein BGO30_08560 [Bacteroidetes bacterium 41-46]|nr:MAG: hypothetical protein BGO30_08560 [Bacteroidetes bacterium 41-46]